MNKTRKISTLAGVILGMVSILSFGLFANSAAAATAAFAPPGGAFGPVSTGPDGVAGSTGYRQGYTVEMVSDTGACVQARGYLNDGKTETWFDVGCLAGGEKFSVTVPWGNSLAMPAIRIKSVGAPLGATAEWW